MYVCVCVCVCVCECECECVHSHYLIIFGHCPSCSVEVYGKYSAL